MTKAELSSIFDFRVFRNGRQIGALRWLPKTHQYSTRVDGRDVRITRDLEWHIQDQVSNYFAHKIFAQNQKFKRGEIDRDIWEQRIAAYYYDVSVVFSFVLNGGLDKSIADEVFALVCKDKELENMRSENWIDNGSDLRDILARLDAGDFGPNFELGNFDQEVFGLFEFAMGFVADTPKNGVK